MANYTISGAATMPDNVTPLRGTWEISLYSSTGTVEDVDGTWRGSSQRYQTNADGSLSITLPETTSNFLYRATFISRDRRTQVGPIVFALTANRTWQSVIGTPSLTPTPPSIPKIVVVPVGTSGYATQPDFTLWFEYVP